MFKLFKKKKKKSKELENNKEKLDPMQPNPINLKSNLTRRHLIVDDVGSNRFVLRKFLENVGVQSDEASNGQDALRFFEPPLDKKYDIIWVDLKMPIMNGFELAKILRSKKYDGLIIGVTGNVERESIEKALKCGMDRIIGKPIVMKEFYELQFVRIYK